MPRHKIKTMIPYGKQQINQDDIDAVVTALKSDFITQGPLVPAFEQAIANYCQAKHAVACNSATSALHLACLALGLGTDDILWTSPITFVASANCGLYCGAKVDFVDIEAESFNLCPKKLKTKLEQAQHNKQLPKIVVVVHMAGLSCNMQAIALLAQEYGFKIIEDASHAIGGSYLQHKIGGCQYSDITIFSFHPVKIITSVEGGMAVTNSLKLTQKMVRFRSHGITREPNNEQGGWYYQQLELGFNYRMNDLQAALGLNQLKRLDSFIQKRQQLADIYKQALAGLPIEWQQQSQQSLSAYHLFIITLTGVAPIKRKQLYDTLQAAGIGVNVHYIPVHTQPYYQQLGFKMGDYPIAEHYYQHCLSLPLYPDLSQSQQQKVITKLQTELCN